MYAVVRTGGKQYRVEPGAILEVEKLPVEQGANVDLDEVLLIEDGGALTVGTPTIAGAKVVAEVLAQGRGDKIIVQKYKAKVRYRRRVGHRQPLTRLSIREIVVGGPPASGGGQSRAPRRGSGRASSRTSKAAGAAEE